MSYQHGQGVHAFNCDARDCHRNYCVDDLDDDGEVGFDVALAEAKDSSWRVFKTVSGWQHLCPRCQTN